MKIGEFSQLTNIPVKTLRYYSDIGLLKPASIEDNNYRYYGIEQLSKLNRIIDLKESGFTLNEIISISNNKLTENDLIRLLMGKLEIAKKEKAFAEAKVRKIESELQQLTNKKESKMLLKNINVPPFHNTLMGVVKAVSDFYSLNISDAMIYGGSGHAFMINIHDELCPSGPYVWNHEPFYQLLSALGITMTDHGFFSNENSLKDRADIEKTIKDHLKSNNPCALVNLEYQLISGYDETGFITSQPWSEDFPPGHLTFTTWDEMEDEIHACFFTFDKTEPTDTKSIVINSLKYALSLNECPDLHTSEPYYTGLKAYDAFIEAVENGCGSSHGNWWNATVWGECRKMASEYFNEIGKRFKEVDSIANELADDYNLISQGLIKVAEKEVPVKPKIELLKEIRSLEAKAMFKITEMLNKFNY